MQAGITAMKHVVITVSKILLIVLLLYLFLVSIGMMEVAFKGFGRGFAEYLIKTTSNPFVGLFIGILATSIVQSSSLTTSIVVGMVGSGVITVGNAIPIIMGANIGTTVTNTIVSLSHIVRREEFRRAMTAATVHDFFNLICVCVFFPLEMLTGFLRKVATLMGGAFSNAGGFKLTNPINTITNPTINFIKHVFVKLIHTGDKTIYILMLVTAVIILFFSLYYLVRIMKSLVVKRVEAALDSVLRKSAMICILGGAVFTAIIQSSSVTTSLLVPLAASGIVTVDVIFPITLGANIGTTVTAILASFGTAATGGNVSALVIAFVHLLFNVTGTLMIYPLRSIRMVPIRLATSLGNLASRKRLYAFIYVMTVFYIFPALMILISRFFK